MNDHSHTEWKTAMLPGPPGRHFFHNIILSAPAECCALVIRPARADDGVPEAMPLARGLGTAQVPKNTKTVESWRLNCFVSYSSACRGYRDRA
jgi:hypothetical protein